MATASQIIDRERGRDKTFNHWADKCVCSPWGETSTNDPSTGKKKPITKPKKSPLDGNEIGPKDDQYGKLNSYCDWLDDLEKEPTEDPWVDPCDSFLSENQSGDLVDFEARSEDEDWLAGAYDCVSKNLNKNRNPYDRDKEPSEELKAWGRRNNEKLFKQHLREMYSDDELNLRMMSLEDINNLKKVDPVKGKPAAAKRLRLIDETKPLFSNFGMGGTGDAAFQERKKFLEDVLKLKKLNQGRPSAPQGSQGQQKGPQGSQGQQKAPQGSQGQQKGPQGSQGQQKGQQKAPQGQQKAQQKAPQGSQSPEIKAGRLLDDVAEKDLNDYVSKPAEGDTSEDKSQRKVRNAAIRAIKADVFSKFEELSGTTKADTELRERLVREALDRRRPKP